MIISGYNAGAAVLNWLIKRNIASSNIASGYINDVAIVGNKIYYSDTGNNWNPVLRVVNATTGALITSITLSSSGLIAAVGRMAVQGTDLFVPAAYQQYASNQGVVFRVNTLTDTVVTQYSNAPLFCQDVHVSQDGSKGFMVTGGGQYGGAQKFTPPNIGAAVATNGLPSRVFYYSTLVESGSKLYMAGNGNIAVVNTSTNAYVKDVTALSGYLHSVSKVLDAGNSRAYIFGYNSDYSKVGFLIIDTSTDAVIGHIDITGLEYYCNIASYSLIGTDLVTIGIRYDSVTATQEIAIITFDTLTHTVKSVSKIAEGLPGGNYGRLGWASKPDTGDIYFGTYTVPSAVYQISQTTDSFVPGKGSTYFDGSGDYLTAASNSAFAFGTGDFTIETWLRLDTIGDMGIASTYSGWSFQHRASYGGVVFMLGDTVLISAAHSTSLTWVHVAVSRSGSNLRIFFDGVQQGATVTNSSNITAPSGLTIGNLGPSYGYHLKGFLSNLRIVKGTAVYTTNFTPPTAPLAAISGTSMLTCSTLLTKDLSANNFTITANGEVKNMMLSPFVPTTTA